MSIHPMAQSTIAATMLCGLASFAVAQVTLPPSGTILRYECSGLDEKDTEVRLQHLDGGKYRTLDILDGKEVGYRIREPWHSLTTIYEERLRRGEQRTMRVESGDLSGVGKLQVGSKHEAWYGETNPRGRARWNYKIEVTEKKTVDTKHFGKQDVLVVTESRWTTGNYASTQTLHYAPSLGTSTYYVYTDTNKLNGECHLRQVAKG